MAAPVRTMLLICQKCFTANNSVHRHLFTITRPVKYRHKTYEQIYKHNIKRHFGVSGKIILYVTDVITGIDYGQVEIHCAINLAILAQQSILRCVSMIKFMAQCISTCPWNWWHK